MTPTTIIPGSKISFQAGGVAGTPATFVSDDVFGIVDTGSIAVSKDQKEMTGYKSGNPGVRVLVDKRTTKIATSIKFTLEELHDLAFELGFALDGSGNIYQGPSDLKGWIKVEVYNGTTATKTITAYGVISLDGDLNISGEDYAKPAFVFDVLNGTVADPA